MAENAYATKRLVDRKELFNKYKIEQQLIIYKKSQELMATFVTSPKIKAFIDIDYVPKLVKTELQPDNSVTEILIFPEIEHCVNGILWYFVIKSTTYREQVPIKCRAIQSTKKEINANIRSNDDHVAEEVQKSLKIIISKFLL